MTTNPLPTITPLPVLIKSGHEASVDGVGAIFISDRPEISGLHVVSQREAFAHLDKLKRSQPDQWRLVSGLALLQRALKEQDWSLFQNALDLVKMYVPHVFTAEIHRMRGSGKWKDARWAYSGLMSNLLQMSRFIVWYSSKDQQPQPGLFCPDVLVSVYAVVGMDHMRKCEKPGCDAFFIPSKKEHTHCSEAHANAHRVARWKKSHPEQAKELGRRKSTEKTSRESLR